MGNFMNIMLLSSNMEQKGNDDEGILGFLAVDIQKELRRGKRLVCSYCKKNGATLGCCNTKCKKIFHFPCGLEAGSLHQFFGEFRSYCITHRPKQKVDERVKKEAQEVTDLTCYICYDKVDHLDYVKTLWAPCCKKNAWFHRTCVQQLAMSAGYFFKCPLCNNKNDFQKAMLDYGIFIPSQDASWELVPNAFQELLYRHDQCDAEVCLCPKGRKHTSSNAKWELTLCRTCGSQGIHMACGQLKWANPVWDCKECTSILRKSKDNMSSATSSSDSGRVSSKDSFSDSDDTDTDISVGRNSPISITINEVDKILPPVNLRPGPRSFKLRQMKMCQISESAICAEDEDAIKPLLNSGCSSRDLLVERAKFSSSSSCSPQINVITIDSDDDLQVVNCSELNETSKNTSSMKTPILATTANDQDTKESNITLVISKDTALSMNEQNKCIAEDLCTTERIALQKLGTVLYNETEGDTSQDTISNSIMNIKISNVTSLPPEEFASVPDVIHAINGYAEITPTTHENIPESQTGRKNSHNICTEIPIVGNTIHNRTISSVKDDFKTNLKRKSDAYATDTSHSSPNISIPSNVKKIRGNNANGNISSLQTVTNDMKKSLQQSSQSFVATNFILYAKDVLTNSVNTVSQSAQSTSVKNNINPESHDKSGLILKYLPLQNDLNRPNKSNAATGNDNDRSCITPLENVCSINSNATSNNIGVAQANGSLFIRFPQSGVKNLLISQQITPQQADMSNQNTMISDQIYSIPCASGKPEKMEKKNVNMSNTTKPKQIISTPVTMKERNNNQTLFLAEPANKNMILHDVGATNNNRNMTNDKAMYSKTILSGSVSSSNDSHLSAKGCDGDAGTSPASEPGFKLDAAKPNGNSTMGSCASYRTESSDESRNRNFNETSNTSFKGGLAQFESNSADACDLLRLIPDYVNLRDLKFRVCGRNNLQMILYDMFSINVDADVAQKKNANANISIEKLAVLNSSELLRTKQSRFCSNTDCKTEYTTDTFSNNYSNHLTSQIEKHNRSAGN